MRFVLLLLGIVLLLQVAFGLVDIARTGVFSFQLIGAVIDANLVKITAALTALSVARMIKR